MKYKIMYQEYESEQVLCSLYFGRNGDELDLNINNIAIFDCGKDKFTRFRISNGAYINNFENNFKWELLEDIETDADLNKLHYYIIDDKKYKIIKSEYNRDSNTINIFIDMKICIAEHNLNNELKKQYDEYISKWNEYHSILLKMDREWYVFKNNKQWYQFWKRFDINSYNIEICQ